MKPRLLLRKSSVIMCLSTRISWWVPQVDVYSGWKFCVFLADIEGSFGHFYCLRKRYSQCNQRALAGNFLKPLSSETMKIVPGSEHRLATRGRTRIGFARLS
jgi:hypothetical protein